MKKALYLLLIVTAALSYGFEVGDLTDKTLEEQRASSGQPSPVFKYEETITPQVPNTDLYQQYYLLIVTSLDEALQTFSENQKWAFRMVHNAYSYFKLLKNLIIDEQKDKFTPVEENLKDIAERLKKTKNFSRAEKMEIKKEISEVQGVLKKDYNFEKVKGWIKT